MMKFPENNARFSWTRHIKNKMVFYNISGAQIMRIFTRPDRREEAIAPGTIGAMKTVKHNIQLTTNNVQPRKEGFSQKKRETEIWIMYKINNKRLTIDNKQKTGTAPRFQSKVNSLKSKVTLISAWRYPGRTKPGERPNIPVGVLEELADEGLI
ncbi:MAG: hypothetical protein Q7R62_03115 [bacterium]|nr:hypothetical protein [bacterium]